MKKIVYDHKKPGVKFERKSHLFWDYEAFWQWAEDQLNYSQQIEFDANDLDNYLVFEDGKFTGEYFRIVSVQQLN